MTTRCAAAMKRSAPALINVENNPAQKLQGIALDCDGVLFDSKDANTAYYNHIRLAVRMPPMTEEEASYSHMVSTDEALERIIPDELQEEARRVRAMTRYRDTFMPMMRPAPHMYAFLKAMKAMGIRMALCTNRSDSVHHVLRHFAMEEYFAPVVTISQVPPKPSPQGLLEIVKAWETTPDAIVFLGDSLVDQQAAAAAGVPFWSYDNPQLAAEIHVSGFKELGEILRLMVME